MYIHKYASFNNSNIIIKLLPSITAYYRAHYIFMTIGWIILLRFEVPSRLAAAIVDYGSIDAKTAILAQGSQMRSGNSMLR